MSRVLAPRKPWPMKWIVLAIVLFIAGYSYLTLHFRKPGKSYEPYADMKNRANTERLLSAGFRRVEVPAERLTDGTVKVNTSLPASGGLPLALKTAIVAPPLIPEDILAVHADDTVAADAPYVLQFRCIAPDDRQQLAGAELYLRGEELVIAPKYEKLGSGLQYRTRETVATVTIPARTLRPATYRVTLVGANASRAWRLQVR